MSIYKKRRVNFDKDKLMFRTKESINLSNSLGCSIQETYCSYATPQNPLGKRWRNDILIRTVKLLQNPKTKTYADFIHKRVDCIQPDQNGEYGTKESIALSIDTAKHVIEVVKESIKEAGFIAPVWELETRDRSVKTKKLSKATLKLIEKLNALGCLTFKG